MSKLKIGFYVFAGNAIVAGIPLITLPLITSLMAPDEFGLFSMAQIIVAFFIPFIGMNLATNYSVHYYTLNDLKKNQLLSSGLTIALFSCLLFEFILFIFFYMTETEYIGDFGKTVIYLLPIFAMFKLCTDLGLVDLRYREKFAAFFVVQSTTSFLIITSIFLIWYFEISDWFYIWTAYYLVYLLAFVTLFIRHHVSENFKFSLKKNVVIESLHFGGKYIPHVLGVTLISMGDRFFIGLILGNQELGFYAAAFQISATVYIVFYSINQVWSQALFRQLSSGINAISTVKSTLAVFMSFVVVLFGLALITPYLFPLLVSDNYLSAQYLVFPIALAFLAQGAYFLLSNYLLFEKKTGTIASFTFAAALFNCVFNYIFITKFGVVGAPFATIASWGIVIVLMFIVLKRTHK